MQFWKSTLFTVAAFLGITSTVLYTSCEKDSCTDLRCKNGGSCAEGFCRCTTGFEGAECEIKTAARFLGTYYGYTHCDQDPSLLDTMVIYIRQEPNVLEFYRYGNPTDVITGLPEGQTIVVQQQGSKYVTVKLDVNNNEINFHVEQPASTQPAGKSVCNFVGYKKKP